MGTGVTATSITVGVEWVQDAGAAGQAAGVDTQYGDMPGDARAVIDWINSHGGVLGRKLVPYFHSYDGASAQSSATQEQAACQDFTVDHHVFAVVTPTAHLDGYADCLDQHHTPLVSTSVNQVVDAQTLARDSHYFLVSNFDLTRLAVAQVNGLYGTGWFGRSARIGLIDLDLPDFQTAVNDSLLPALASHGLHVTDRVDVGDDGSNAAVGQSSAAMQGAVLRFKQDHIDHVLFFTQTTEPLFFLIDADNQQYHPAYGVSTAQGGEALAQTGEIPADQINQITSAGWDPRGDVDPAQQPPATAAARLCNQVLRRAGLDYTDGGTPQDLAFWYCDDLFFLAAALDRATALTAGGFVAAADGLGSNFAPASTYSTYFSGNRHDGADLVRMVRYHGDCRCGYFTGFAYRVP
jgi:ABC-type branched-subunit amino acid transport system substrate-binding protein